MGSLPLITPHIVPSFLNSHCVIVALHMCEVAVINFSSLSPLTHDVCGCITGGAIGVMQVMILFFFFFQKSLLL